MNANQLLSSTVELGLDLLEKHGSFLPFCKSIDAAGKAFIYSPASRNEFTEAQAYESVRSSVLRDLDPRGLVGIAFCQHTRIRFADSAEKLPAVEVQLHYRGQRATIWCFPYRIESGTAQVLHSYNYDAAEDLFAETDEDR